MEETIVLDFEELTLGDIEELEGELGAEKLDKILDGEIMAAGVGSLLKVVLKIYQHTNPEATLDDVRKLKISALSGKNETPTTAVVEELSDGGAPATS